MIIKNRNIFKYLILYLLSILFLNTYSYSQCNFSSETVSTPNTVVNTYFYGATNNVGIGSTSITFGPAVGATTPIEEGDMLLIIQIQDAQINSTNTTSYGSGVSGDPSSGYTTTTAGHYEFVFAANDLPISGGVLTLKSPTINSYINENFGTQGQKRYQVMRVPRFQNLTIAPGASITAQPWNGNAGGIIVLDVIDTLNMSGNGKIDVSGLGFRGGGARRLLGAAGLNNTDRVVMSTFNANASKGEGIAGTPRYVNNQGVLLDTGVEGYPNGSYGMGAPGNAGGGGTDGNTVANDDNSGGGGGGNGGAGGRGGNSWRSNVPSGGFGGVKPDFLSINRLIFGGGGGAGTINDNPGIQHNSSGAAGGGIVILRVGTIINAGLIEARGLTALDVLNDGAGGGGAGGTVFIDAKNSNSLANLVVNVNGGNGGNVWPLQGPGGYPGNRHGPGGGGGAGVIYANGDLHPNSSAERGLNGTATSAQDSYNSIPGFEGVEDQSAPPIPVYNPNNIDDDICEIPRIRVSISPAPVYYENIGDTVTFTITVTNTGNANLTNVFVEATSIGFYQFIGNFAQGATQTFYFDYSITASDINNGSKFVQVLAQGLDSDNDVVNDLDNTTIFELASIAGCPDLAISRLQYASNTSNTETNTATFSVQPEEGSLIVAISFHDRDGEIPSIAGTGWTIRTFNVYGIVGDAYGPANTSHRRGISVFTKTAGSNEPTSVTMSWTAASRNSILIQEFKIEGGSLVFNSAVSNNNAATTTNSLFTGLSSATADNSIVITAIGGRGGALNNLTWDSGVINSIGINGNNRSIYSGFGLFHNSSQKSSTATWTSTARMASAAIVVFDFIPSTPPVTPDLIVTQPNCDEPSGSIIITNPIASNLEYTVNNGTSFQNSPNFYDLAAGNYTVYARNKVTECTSSKQVVQIFDFDTALCGVCPPALPISRRQSASGLNSATFSVAPIEGNLLVATAIYSHNTTTTRIIVENGWTLRRFIHSGGTNSDNRRGLAIWTKIAGSSEGTTVTPNFNTAPNLRDNNVIIQEFNIPAGSSLAYFGDADNNSGNSTTVTSLSSGTITNNTMRDFFVVASFGGRDDMGSPHTYNNGLSDAIIENGNPRSISTAFGNITTGGNISTTASWPNSRVVNSAIIAFQVTKPEPLGDPIVTTVQTDCDNFQGSLTITQPVGANYEYSINGVDFQTSNVFNNLNPGTYPVSAYNTLTTCISNINNVVIYPRICAYDNNLDTMTISGGNNVINVLNNDSLGNSLANISTVSISLVAADPSGTLILNTVTGNISVAPNSMNGSYSLQYEICEIANPNNCSQAEVTVYIKKGIIINAAYCNCSLNAPYLVYDITPNFSTNDTLTIRWINMNDSLVAIQKRLSYFGNSIYPGSDVDSVSGVGIDWTGWLQNIDGHWYEGDDGFFTLKPQAKIQFAINPVSDTVIVTYPDETFDCIAEPTSNLLPVTWLSFDGVHDGEVVLLEWKTASEINNDYFSVERSSNGFDFEEIGTVFGAGNSNVINRYNFTDFEPLAAYSYYRLKQVDFDSQFEYSEIIAVKGSEVNTLSMKVFPNPFSDIIVVDNGDKEIGYIRVYDSSGKILFHELFKQTNTTINLNHLDAGTYYLSNEFGVITKLVKRK
jgi:hypothetical protein